MSVVVPTLNQAAFLECALESIVAQETPVELIVVDGGSTDGTAEILARWQPRMAWWRSRPDAGQSAAINEGMLHATAPYVAWLNSDDWYLPGGLDTLVAELDRHPEAPGVYGDALNADEQGRTTGRYWTQDFTRFNLGWRCFISQPATLLRRSTWEAMGGVNESLHFAMDYDLWWRIFNRFGPLTRVRRTVAVNRVHGATKTRTSRKAQCLEAMAIVKRNLGRVPSKWYLAWPYSVWYKTWRYGSPAPSRNRFPVALAAAIGPGGPRVLVVKLAAIGDVVMALPMVTAIRAKHPDAHVAWMCGTSLAPLIRRVAGIDECIVVDERALLAGSTIEKLKGVLLAWRQVAGRRFDAVYIAHSDPRYRLLAATVIAGTRRSLRGNRVDRALIHRRTYTDEYVRLVTGIDDFRAVGYAPPAIAGELSRELAERIDRFANGRPIIAITPGGARNVARENPLRRWPLARYASLAAELDARGFAVVVAGDQHDAWVREAFDARVLDLVGQTSLVELTALFRRCLAVVSHDTGPLHIARLVATNVVGLFGPTPPSMFFRREAHTRALWPGEKLPCAPCYDGVEFARCGNNLCMQLIECRAVLEVIDGLEATRRPEHASLLL